MRTNELICVCMRCFFFHSLYIFCLTFWYAFLIQLKCMLYLTVKYKKKDNKHINKSRNTTQITHSHKPHKLNPIHFRDYFCCCSFDSFICHSVDCFAKKRSLVKNVAYFFFVLSISSQIGIQYLF